MDEKPGSRKEIFIQKLLGLGYENTKNYGYTTPGWRNKGEISSLISTTPDISHYQKDIENRKLIKIAFSQASNSLSPLEGGRVWFNTMQKVFWLGWATRMPTLKIISSVESFLEKYGESTNLAEFSCVGFPDGLENITAEQKAFTKVIGFQIEGNVRYACAEDCWSNERSRAHSFVKKYYREKGKELPIRPAASAPDSLSSNVVLSADDVPSHGLVGEIIIKNWEITGIVVNTAHHAKMRSNPPWRETLRWLETLEETYPEYEIIYI